jgi:hypothetical protein
MRNMILTEEKRRASFCEEFKDDQIGASELFSTVGGIEKADYSATGNILVIYVFYAMRSIKSPDDKLYAFGKNVPDGNNFFPYSPVFPDCNVVRLQQVQE